jgi:hypothetical protein
MRWGKAVSVTAATAALACLPTAMAFAAFEGKESTGKGNTLELTLEAGGGKVICQHSLATENVAWTIEQTEGKAATKGPDLVADIQSWGTCTAESSEFAKTSATLSACEMELKQTGTELEVPARLLKTCTVKAATCEIKAEMKPNEKLKSVDLAAGGPVTERALVAEQEINDLTTATSGTCPGIVSTKEGKLSGWAPLNKLKSTALQPEIFIQALPDAYTMLTETGKVQVKNLSGVAQVPSVWLTNARPANAFSSTGENTCKVKNYAASGAGSECEFTIEYKARGLALWSTAGRNSERWDAWADGLP